MLIPKTPKFPQDLVRGDPDMPPLSPLSPWGCTAWSGMRLEGFEAGAWLCLQISQFPTLRKGRWDTEEIPLSFLLRDSQHLSTTGKG